MTFLQNEGPERSSVNPSSAASQGNAPSWLFPSRPRFDPFGVLGLLLLIGLWVALIPITPRSALPTPWGVIDTVIQGGVLPLDVFGKLVFVGFYYTVFYTFASWFIFADKEF